MPQPWLPQSPVYSPTATAVFHLENGLSSEGSVDDGNHTPVCYEMNPQETRLHEKLQAARAETAEAKSDALRISEEFGQLIEGRLQLEAQIRNFGLRNLLRKM